MRFLIQRINGEVVHDFANELLQAKKFVLWLDKEEMETDFCEGLNFDSVRNPGDCIPVGSVEFVSAFLRKYYPQAEEALRPLNVPDVLFPFAGRTIANVWWKEDYAPFKKEEYVFCKSLDTIKSSWNGMHETRLCESKDFRHCQVSQLIDIASEWRVIVFHNEPLYVGYYGGNPLAFPSPLTISEMIKTYSPEAPVAYTLDVARTAEGETVVIECHRFFSCGLYGFSDWSKLPYMFSQEWFEMKNTRSEIA